MIEAIEVVNRNYKKFFYKDLDDSFRSFINFSENTTSDIVNYYLGFREYNPNSFEYLSKLLKEFEGILENLSLFKDSFQGSIYWEVLSISEDIYTKLQSLNKANKYLRSNLVKGGYSSGNQISYVLKQNENIEAVGRKFFDEEYWSQIAIKNKIREEDYSPKGGTLLNFIIPTNNYSNKGLRDVLGSTEGEKVYGRDLDASFKYKDNDLNLLTGRQTFVQALNILSNLRQGDNPEFLKNGLKKNLIGSNINSLAFPILFENIMATYSNDDTVSSICIRNVKIEGAELKLDYEIISKAEETFEGFIKMS